MCRRPIVQYKPCNHRFPDPERGFMLCTDRQTPTDPPHTVEDDVREELRSFCPNCFRYEWITEGSYVEMEDQRFTGEKQLMARRFEEFRRVHITSWSQVNIRITVNENCTNNFFPLLWSSRHLLHSHARIFEFPSIMNAFDHTNWLPLTQLSPVSFPFHTNHNSLLLWSHNLQLSA